MMTISYPFSSLKGLGNGASVATANTKMFLALLLTIQSQTCGVTNIEKTAVLKVETDITASIAASPTE